MLTDSLAKFVANPGLDAPDRETTRIVTFGFVDTVATMLGGRAEPVVGIVESFVTARKSEQRESSILLGNRRCASTDAALINATSAHALDFDDVALGGHPSTVLVPAVLAEGEYIGASGRDVIRAYLVGYEVWSELVQREPDSYHVKGWHPTAVLGTVATAAAVAHLHRLPSEQCRNAIALAASMASGLVANFGTMVKPFHAGRAASCGIDSARLAMAGMSAADDVLEHSAGFLAALSPQGNADRGGRVRGPGRDWRIRDTGLSIKKYPVCYAVHRVIDGVLDLASAHSVKWDEVQAITVTIGVTQASMLRNHEPRTALEAKFSLEFAVAAALVAGAVGLRELTNEFVQDPRIRQVMSRVSATTVTTRCPIEPVFALNDQVVLHLSDGRTIDSGPIRYARGNAMLPVGQAELKEKFDDCISRSEYIDRAMLYRQLSQLQDLDNVRELVPGR